MTSLKTKRKLKVIFLLPMHQGKELSQSLTSIIKEQFKH